MKALLLGSVFNNFEIKHCGRSTQVTMARLPLLLFLVFIHITLFAQEISGVRLYSYRSAEGNVSEKSLEQLFQEGAFLPSSSSILIDRNNTKPLFIAVQVPSSSPTGGYKLVVEDCFLDEITFWEGTPETSPSQVAGALYPFHQRPLAFHYPVFSFSKSTAGNELYFLKIQNFYHNSVIPIRIFTEKNFDQFLMQEYLFWGIYLGVLVLMLFISLAMLVIKEFRKFLYVFLAILSNIIWILFNNGLGFQFLWPNSPELMETGRFTSYHFSILFLFLCFEKFIVNQPKTHFQQRLYQVLHIGMWFSIFFGFNPFQLTNENPWFAIYFFYANFLQLSILIIIIYQLLKEIQKQNVNAWFYLLSFFIVLISHISLILIKYHIIPAVEWVFFLNYIGIFIQVITLLVSFLLQYIQQRRAHEMVAYSILAAQESERQRIAVDMHDELGASFSTIKLLSELALNQKKEGKLKEYLQIIHQKSTDINQTLREIIWTLQSSNDTLEGLIDYVVSYGRTYFNELSIQFTVDCPNELPLQKIDGSRRRHILLILKELFQNIGKHAFSERSSLKVSFQEGGLVLIVRDFGRGMLPDFREGNGLKNIRMRIQSLNGEIKISNPKGLEVQLIIPL